MCEKRENKLSICLITQQFRFRNKLMLEKKQCYKDSCALTPTASLVCDNLAWFDWSNVYYLSCIICFVIVDTRESVGNTTEQLNTKIEKGISQKTHLFHIVSGFTWCLDKHNIQFGGFAFAVFCWNLTFVGQISFISNEHNNDIRASFSAHIVNPFGSLMERVCI